MDTFYEVVQLMVTPLTIIAFLFQFQKTITFKDASGISYISQSIVSVGAGTWMLYGGAAKETAPGVVNAVIFIPLMVTLYMSLKDNGVQKRNIIFTMLPIGIFGTGAFIFFILAMSDTISGSYMEGIGLFGVFIGGTFTATGFMPQTYKTIKSKDVKSLSLPMTATYSVAQTLWIMLFTLIMVRAVDPSMIVTITNTWSVITAVIPTIIQYTLLFAILKWGKKKNERKI